jgi:predicted component of type VI protein secretion system
MAQAGGDDSQALNRLIRLYAPDQLDFDVELRLKKDELPPLQLGNELAQLGRISWLGTPQEDVSVVVAPNEIRNSEFGFRNEKIPNPELQKSAS